MKQLVAAVLVSLLLAGCKGGSSSGPVLAPPVMPDDVDTLSLATSQLWSSAASGVRVSADYDLNTDTLIHINNRDIRASGFDVLRDSRVAFYQDTGRLLADDYGDTFLELLVTADGDTVNLGSATRAVSDGCDVGLTQALDVAGNAAQGTLHWVHTETVTFTDNGGAPTCSQTLADAAGVLFAATSSDFAFDLVTLVGLQAVDSLKLGDLRGWTLEHVQSIAKYYRAIGDANFELARADQRIDIQVFDSASVRAEALVEQLTL